MSRTYRRKTAQPNRDLRQDRIALTMWHTDNAWIMGNAPSWYCNLFERTCRRSNTHELHKYISQQDYEPINWCRHRSTATYAWW